jgi:cleavage and polyadenylation specificity factor subunit 3
MRKCVLAVSKKNSCVIPGYVVEGTLAKTRMNEPKEVTLLSGLVVPLNMRVQYISFSAHADFTQTSAHRLNSFVSNVNL